MKDPKMHDFKEEIWHNQYIINNTTVLLERMGSKGNMIHKSVVNEQVNQLCQKELQNKFKIKCDFLQSIQKKAKHSSIFSYKRRRLYYNNNIHLSKFVTILKISINIENEAQWSENMYFEM